ncbi:MAG: hypothetical protein IJ197_01345 [Bacteroidaceae bacterium]|nr:hypothetical protein [Bacteroidaceae bacterium]
MAINYSYVPITSNPRDKKAKWHVYANVQSTGTVTTRDIAAHLASHNSVFSEGTIIGLLQDAHRCILEQLQRGAYVNLDDLGTFYPTLKCRGADTVEEFTQDNIERINIRWRPSKRMEKAIQRTPLNLVSRREDQRRSKRKMGEQLNQEIAESKVHE